MAGKAHVDDSVIERRLRPIYDWLDSGNNKKAAQEADKVLRKQPKLQCASVLKALALLRLGRNEECSDLINSIVSIGTSDDATLQALTICYREMHQPELICSIYEKATKLDPTNEDILSHLFMAHVRVGDYKKQQLTAMQLYKLKPKNPYYFWAVMSIVMQSHVSKDLLSKKVSLQLAERMTLKFVNDDKIESEAEVLTYLYILEIQEKYKEALMVLDGQLARKIVQQPQNFISMKRAFYYTHMKEYDVASIIYMKLILDEPDNWQHYVRFTEIIIFMWRDFANACDEETSPLLAASQFLKDNREKTLLNMGFHRSPLLGLLQLALKLKEEGLWEKIEVICGSVTDQLHEYIKHFGDKMCCYGDIVNFLPLISREEVPLLLEKIESLVNKDPHGIPIDIKNIYRHQIWLQLKRALRDYDILETEKELELADELVSFYERTAVLSSTMASTDIRPNDTYLILAAHSYFSVLPQYVMKAGSCTGEDKRVATNCVTNLLVKLCCLLEHGTNISKANFQLKLLLLKAYNLIGATGASYNVYEKLDLKQIQMDTLGHFLTLHTLDTGNFTIAANIFSSTLKFFMANYKDTSDPLIMSYKYGSLIRIPEFVEFRERLNNSLHFATVTAEQMILELTTRGDTKSELEDVMKQLDIDPANEKTNWEDLRDNRDLLVMNTWEPEGRRLQPAAKQETFSDETRFLKLRNTILRIIAASYSLRKAVSKTNLNNNKEKSAMVNGDLNGTCDNDFPIVLKDLTDNLRSQTESCDKYRISKPPQVPLQGPDIPRIYLYAKGYHLQPILKHAEAVLKIYDCTEGSQGLDSWSGDVLKRLLENVDQLLSFHSKQLDALQMTYSTALPGVNSQPLGHLSHFVQTVSLVVIFLECCHSLLVPVKLNIAKKNKKKKGNVALPEIIHQFNNYITALHSKFHKFELRMNDKLTTSLKSENEPPNANNTILHQDFEAIIPDLDQKTVCESIKQSFSDSLSILTMVVKGKLKLLNTLKI